MTNTALIIIGALLTTNIFAQINETSKWEITRPEKQVSYSEDIFGMADASTKTFQLDKPTVNRWGGNTTTRYNWKLGNAWNTGKDWFFENIDAGPNRWQRLITKTLKNNAKVIVTVPIMGYVAKDTTSHGFSVKKYGNQQKTDQWRQDAGNGVKYSGEFVTGTSPFDTSTAISTSFVSEWIQKIEELYPKAIEDGRIIFALDNEPMLWHETHRDAHPDPTGYAEYISKYKSTASAIKKVAPKALLAGPDVWGWIAYTKSAKDNESGRDDDKKQFDDEFIPWFLKQMRMHEESTGEKLLDYLTIHYYPQAKDVFSDNASIPVAMDRVMAPRSLYDASYKDPSWINERIMLIPRAKAWIDKYYPGTKLGITEYNWGAEADMSGALALADSLGIFATQQLDLACYWTWPPPQTKAELVFRLYRNVDGQYTKFPTQLLETKLNSIDNNLTSLYAAENDKTLSLIAINKTTTKTNFKFSFNNIDLYSNIVYYINDDSEDIEKHQQGCTFTNGQYMMQADGKSVYHIIFNKTK